MLVMKGGCDERMGGRRKGEIINEPALPVTPDRTLVFVCVCGGGMCLADRQGPGTPEELEEEVRRRSAAWLLCTAAPVTRGWVQNNTRHLNTSLQTSSSSFQEVNSEVNKNRNKCRVLL